MKVIQNGIGHYVDGQGICFLRHVNARLTLECPLLSSETGDDCCLGALLLDFMSEV